LDTNRGLVMDVMKQITEATELLSQVKKSLVISSSEANELEAKIADDLKFAKDSTNLNLNVESVRGVRTPKWYTLDIAFEAGESQSKSRAFEISSEGAFVLSSIQAFFKYDTANIEDYLFGEFLTTSTATPNGRYVPVSTFPIVGNGTLVNIGEVAASSPSDNISIADVAVQQMYDIPEFSFNFQIDSIALQWADKPIPGGFIYTLDNPLYFNGDCYVDRSERIITTAKPDVRVPVKGIVRLVLHGYQILGEVTPENHNRI
jgi:hypothetical protein